ncbi:MAG: diguanylate cyclase, partial [Erysipelotrichaceae bacterium]|nr:diguanylate cyclase [Erysipelotrichaceae bacterium]
IANGVVVLLVCFVGLLIKLKKQYIPAILLNLLIGPALFANIWLYVGNEFSIQYFFITLTILPFITISRKLKIFQWLFALASVAMLTLLLNFEFTGTISGLVPLIVLTVSNYSVVGINLLFVSLMFATYIQQIENYEDQLKLKESEIANLFEEVQRRAIEDLTTGAVTHRKVEELIYAEIARSDRYETPFSLIMFSFSDIKEIFAVYGQEKGEKIMEQLVQIVRSDLRLVDVLGRWTDGDFVIFMPEIKLHQAVYVAQRLVSIIAVTDFLPKIKLPSNFAVVQRLPGENFDLLISRLNGLMQKSRSEGENRITN